MSVCLSPCHFASEFDSPQSRRGDATFLSLDRSILHVRLRRISHIVLGLRPLRLLRRQASGVTWNKAESAECVFVFTRSPTTVEHYFVHRSCAPSKLNAAGRQSFPSSTTPCPLRKISTTFKIRVYCESLHNNVILAQWQRLTKFLPSQPPYLTLPYLTYLL